MKHEHTTTPGRMSNNVSRLQFVVRFATMDLNGLRPGDWLNLRDDLLMFVGVGAPGFLVTDTVEITGSVSEPPFPEDWPQVAFHALQAEVRAILHRFFDLRQGQVTGPSPGKTSVHITLEIYPAGPHAPDPSYKVLWLGGRIRDMFVYVLYYLLSHERTDRIQQCPECRTFFYRVKKQAYCSRSCANRVTQRRWRERQETATTA